MNIDKTAYNRDGFLLLKGFFPAEKIKSIYDDARRIFYRQFLAKGYVGTAFEKLENETFDEALFRLFREDFDCLANCGKHAQHLVSLHRLSLEEKIMDVLKAVGLSAPNICTRPVLFFNHPNVAKKKVYHTVDAHQDWRSMQGSLNASVIWVPLMDIDRSLGALEIIPGSHLWGLKANSLENGFGMVEIENPGRDFMAVEVERGDVLLFSAFLVHQSGNNSSATPRWSCHFRYNDLDEPSFIRRGYPHPYIYKPAEELLVPGFPASGELRKIFGQ